MIIESIKLGSLNGLVDVAKTEHLNVTIGDNGKIKAIRWLYGTSDDQLYGKVKKLGGEWNRGDGGWVFKNPRAAEEMFSFAASRNPGWPVTGDPLHPFKSLAGLSISRLRLTDKVEACLTPPQFPPFSYINGDVQAYRLTDENKRKVGLVVGTPDEIDAAINSMIALGATCDDTLSNQWPLIKSNGSKLNVKVAGWTIHIIADLSDPLHLSLSPTGQWNGVRYTTRARWAALQSSILAAGLECVGDDPAQPLSVSAHFNTTEVAGWHTPAPSGHLMHAYQKIGAEFCASRNMRALIGDEMGVGKTVQAIAAAEASAADRIAVFCPANARYVWDREIREWGGKGKVQHITNQLDELDKDARWHVITYDLVVSRSETWKFIDKTEADAFQRAFPQLKTNVIKSKDGSALIKLTEPLLPQKGMFSSAKRLDKWINMMERLGGKLRRQLLEAGHLLLILDEAHRLKNRDAKRTQVIKEIVGKDNKVLMLTGTPLRNNEHEAAVLLGILDPDAATNLTKANGYTIQDIKDYLSYFMIRRTKLEVLPELPEKIRQRIDISDLDEMSMLGYEMALKWAHESYNKAIADGRSEAEARQAMQGGIEKARTALGLAKVLGGEVADLVLDVVENKGCCVVFCAHHQVSDELHAQLLKSKLKAKIIDGRTQQKERASIVADFQGGHLDVIIGGINAAGEAITLTRADTVIFVELDWVPAALLQAEDRIHRVGQRNSCQIIQLIAMTPGENLDEMMVDVLGDKMLRIGEVLNENTANVISASGTGGGIQAQIMGRLLQNKTAVGVTPAARDQRLTTKQAASEPVEKPARAATTTKSKTTGTGRPAATWPFPSAGNTAPALAPAPAKPILEPAFVAPRVETDISVEAKPLPKKRGRPMVYTDKQAPSAAERSAKSNKGLAASGGKRIMLRLTPEANEALKLIMAAKGEDQQTSAISQMLVRYARELSNPA